MQPHGLVGEMPDWVPRDRMHPVHRDHEAFISGIGDRRKVILTFASKEDAGLHLTRTCAPMDYGPSRRTIDPSDRYHFWDYDATVSKGVTPSACSQGRLRRSSGLASLLIRLSS